MLKKTDFKDYTFAKFRFEPIFLFLKLKIIPNSS